MITRQGIRDFPLPPVGISVRFPGNESLVFIPIPIAARCVIATMLRVRNRAKLQEKEVREDGDTLIPLKGCVRIPGLLFLMAHSIHLVEQSPR